MPTVTGTTEVLSLTESAATINAERIVTCTTEALAFTESAAAVSDYFIGDGLLTFSGLTAVAGVGNTTDEYLHETAYASDHAGGVWDFTLTEVAIAGEIMTAIDVQSLSYTVEASEATEEKRLAALSDSAIATNDHDILWTANLWDVVHLRDRDEVWIEYTESITDVVTATDSFAQIGRAGVLSDSVTAAEELTTTATFSGNLHETASASDLIFALGYGGSLVDGNTVQATEYFEGLVTPQEILASSANVSNTTEEYNVHNVYLSDSATVEELLTQAAGISNETLETVIKATEILWANDFGALAWILNTETGGLSTYDNYGYNSIAMHDGVLYATSPEGVFAMTQDKDQSRHVDAEVQTGMMDFEIEHTKRISDIFVGYTGGQLEYSVETYDGPNDIYSYEMPERDADAPRNNRVKPGRGLSSRYWRFTIKNIDGADFQLHDQTAVIGASNRRL